MKALLYIIRRTFKNLFKGVFKKPTILIGYIFVLAFVVLLLVASFFMPSGSLRIASPNLFAGIIMLVFAFMYFTYLKIGIEKGSTYFRMADVNLAFTAPIKPNNILLYGFIKQIGGTVLLLFLALCQIPNLKNNFEFKPYGTWMIILAVFLFAMSYPLIGMIIYSWSSKDKKRKKRVKYIFNLVAIAIVVATLLILYRTKSITETIEIVFNNNVVRYFPIIGWTGSIASAAVLDFTMGFYVGTIGMIVLIAGLYAALYYMKLDYYEDVLEGTEFVEAAVKAKREGTGLSFNVKIKDKVSQKLWGVGARSILSKQLLEYRKTSYLLFFDSASVAIIVSAIIFRIIMSGTAETGLDANISLLYILCFSIYMLLIFHAQGRLNIEMEKPYIYLIPDSPQKKLFYATCAEHIKNFLDGALLFIIAGAIFKAELAVILACVLTYIAFGSVFVYTDVLSRRIFGWVHSKSLKIFIKIIAVILIQIPGIIAAIIAAVSTESVFMAICALGGWSLVLAITMFIFSSSILNNIESAG